MAHSSIDIDRVVREVLARLELAPQADGDAAHSSGVKEAPVPSPSPPDKQQAPAQPAREQRNGELAVPSQVVTMAELEGRLQGVGRLVVSPQAVLTPSVRDELHRKNITLVYDPSAPVPSAGGVRLVMIVLGARFDPAPLTRALQSEGIQVEMHRADCLVAATDQLAAEVVKPDTLGLVASAYPAVALCLANRHRGVRAVLGVDAATVSPDAASVGANLLVVNPGTTSFFQMKQMVSRFCREGPRECPEVLRGRLG